MEKGLSDLIRTRTEIKERGVKERKRESVTENERDNYIVEDIYIYS